MTIPFGQFIQWFGRATGDLLRLSWHEDSWMARRLPENQVEIDVQSSHHSRVLISKTRFCSQNLILIFV